MGVKGNEREDSLVSKATVASGRADIQSTIRALTEASIQAAGVLCAGDGTEDQI